MRMISARAVLHEQAGMGPKVLRVTWRVGVIALCAVLVFIGSLGNGLTDEDYDWLFASSLDGRSLLYLISQASRLRPLSLLLGWAGYRIWDGSALAWHAAVLVVHALCSVQVYCLAKLLSRRDDVGFLAAVIFSVYPRHHEPVLWLAANQFVLSLTWILLALILYVRHLRTGKIVHYALTYLCVVLALASNEVDSVGSALKSWSTTL